VKKKELIKQLDIIISKFAKQSKPQVEPKEDDECKNIIDPHHIINRNHYLFRWDLRNIMFLTRTQHAEQERGLDIDYRTKEQKNFFNRNHNKSLKEYLKISGLTENEFLELKYYELTGNQIKIDVEDTQTVKLRELKPKTNKHKQILKLQSELRKKAYKRMKELRSLKSA
jgi:hypothetical protein